MTDADRAAWKAFVAGVRAMPQTSPRPVFPRHPVANIVPQGGSVIDLHGYKIDPAFRAARDFLNEAHQHGHRHAIVITGRSGSIYAEFPRWADQWRCVRKIEIMPSGGAFRVYLARKHR